MPLMSARPCAMKVANLGHSDRERIQGRGMADFETKTLFATRKMWCQVCCHGLIKMFGIDMICVTSH